jgi:ribosomal protein S12 methylthiotransferase
MARKERKNVTVGFVALGCPKNVVDSERMLAQIVEAGFLITGEPERADVVVINTCGFIKPATLESLEAIRQAVTNKKMGNIRKIIVAGCLSQRLGDELLTQAEGIDAIVGLEHRDAIVQVIRDTLASDEPRVCRGPAPRTVADDRVRLRIGPVHSAYLRISEGCNHRCSFCTIPSIRGPFRSKPPELALDEARELVASGAVELNLIGQDTTLYGRDLKMKGGLVFLLREMEEIADLSWVRLLYAYPTGITGDLVKTIAKSGKVVRYLDLPIQHASNRILKAMRRPDTKDSLRRVIEDLRSAMSDIVLRTTVIVGFPGETEKDFKELLEFVQQAQFDALGAFPFFPEAGTAAAEFPDQVPDEVKQARLDELMQAQQKIAFAANSRRIGSRLTCLVEVGGRRPEGEERRRSRSAIRNPQPAMGRGRFYGQAPDIDGICLIENGPVSPGQFVDAEVIATEGYDLLVRQI